MTLANKSNTRNSSRYITLLEILQEFDISYKVVCSLRNIGAVKTNEEKPLSEEQILHNIDTLKRKLKKKISIPLYQHLYDNVGDVQVSELTWKDPLASRVISYNSKLVERLPPQLRDSFLRPVKVMVPQSLPPLVQKKM